MSPGRLLIIGSFAFACSGNAAIANAADDAAAEALLKKSNCFKCHALDKKKDGPPFRETAKKYREKYPVKAEAEQKLYTHLTTNPKVKVDDKEELHESLKTKNEADIRSVVQWILAR